MYCAEMWVKLMVKHMEGRNLLHMREQWKEWLQEREGIITKSWMMKRNFYTEKGIRAARLSKQHEGCESVWQAICYDQSVLPFFGLETILRIWWPLWPEKKNTL